MTATLAAIAPDLTSSAPRLVSGPHPRAVGSLGDEAVDWAWSRRLSRGRVVAARSWQRYVLRRALEVDEAGALVWRTVVVSAPRQVGKSVLERAACGWRIHQSARFGEPQDVLHVAHKLDAAREVWRPAAMWAAGEYGRGAVRWANGEQQIEVPPDGSRWIIQAANDGAGVAFTLSMVLADEAWRISRGVVDNGLVPTMAETESPQLWIVSTAGTSASDLMHAYRTIALAGADSPRRDASTLIVEWSAPPDPSIDISDPGVWRAASPHWDARRASRVADAYAKVTDDESETAFRQQWLNQWVLALAKPLVDPVAWEKCQYLAPLPSGPVAFGFDVASDRSSATIVAFAAGVLEVVDHRPDVGWLPGRLLDLSAKWRPVGIGCDGGGPALSVADELRGTSADGLLVVLTPRQMSAASGQLFDRIVDATVRSRPNPELDGSVVGARSRKYGSSWSWNRDATSSGVPVIAATCAAWAYSHASVQLPPFRIA